MWKASVVLVMLSAGVVFAAGIGSVVVAVPTCTINDSAGGEGDHRDRGQGRDLRRWRRRLDRSEGGNDLVLAGRGDDYVRGSAGADVVKGGLGRDYLVGGIGPDQVFGADGADRCLNLRDGVSGNDSASGGPGSDTGTRNPGDSFTSIEQEAQAPFPPCPAEPPRPAF
jgi:hypothetical protein